VLFDYKIKDVTHLQGILALPDDYNQAKKRSDDPQFLREELRITCTAIGATFLTEWARCRWSAYKGYITMMPDVFFHTGSSHSDMARSVKQRTEKGDRAWLRRPEAHRAERA